MSADLASHGVLVAAVFGLAGAVKGVVGLGLPTVSLGLLTLAVGLPEAIALMLVPSFVTNVWQGMSGGALAPILGRIWPLLLAAAVGTVATAGAISVHDPRTLTALLRFVLVVYALAALIMPPFRVPEDWEAWSGPLVGTVNGILTGLTGSFVVPATMYLQALGLSRDMLVQSMGLVYAVSTIALLLALAAHDVFEARHGVASTLAVIPALGGMIAGQRLRARLSEAVFRRVFLLSVLGLGAYLGVGSTLH